MSSRALLNLRRADALAADLQDAVRALHRLHDRRAIGHHKAHGLFKVDVLAGHQRVDGHRLVPVVGRGDEDGVDRRTRQQLAVVLVNRRLAARARPRPVQPAGIGIAQRDGLHVGHRPDGLHELLRAGAAANEPHAKPVARGGSGRGTPCHRGGGACKHTRLHEVASIHGQSLFLAFGGQCRSTRFVYLCLSADLRIHFPRNPRQSA